MVRFPESRAPAIQAECFSPLAQWQEALPHRMRARYREPRKSRRDRRSRDSSWLISAERRPSCRRRDEASGGCIIYVCYYKDGVQSNENVTPRVRILPGGGIVPEA